MTANLYCPTDEWRSAEGFDDPDLGLVRGLTSRRRMALGRRLDMLPVATKKKERKWFSVR